MVDEVTNDYYSAIKKSILEYAMLDPVECIRLGVYIEYPEKVKKEYKFTIN